jgi:cobalt-zinc-cadmium efflux system membrane fusion protein
MVNVELATGSTQPVLRVSTKAIQQIEGKDAVFVAKANQNKGFDFEAVSVQVGQRTQDGQWVEITQGLNAGQSYVATGSFLLKSQLEKGEAEHGH